MDTLGWQTLITRSAGNQLTVRVLTVRAFEPMSFNDDTEADALDMLRKNGDLVLSLVAVDNGEIIGHIAFSPAVVGDDSEGWFGIGPVTVTPKRQRTGIGFALMNKGMKQLKAQGAKGCVLTGDPAYYGRFGFLGDGSITYSDTPVKCVQWLAFSSETPKGELKFSEGLQE